MTAKKSTISFIRRWEMPVLHLLFCIAVAVPLFAANGYKALDGPGSSRRSNGKYTLRSSDVTTLLSLATILSAFFASRWSGTVLWKCAMLFWTDAEIADAMRMKKIAWIIEYKMLRLPRERIMEWNWKGVSRNSWRNIAMFAALLPMTVNLLSAPILEGSIDWSSSSEFGSNATVMSGSSSAYFARWRWLSAGGIMANADIQSAAGFAGIAWENSTQGDDNSVQNRRCRHVVNNDKLPAGSIVYNVTIPCIVVHNITWPNTTIPTEVQRVLSNSSLVSVSASYPLANLDNPGVAVIFDPTNNTIKSPPTLQVGPRNASIPRGQSTPIYPPAFLFSGKLTVVLQLSKLHLYEPHLLDPFGYESPHNKINEGLNIDLDNGLTTESASYTFLEVDLTAGVITPAISTYVTSKVVEGGPADPDAGDIQPGPWVKEAMNVMSDAMVSIALMNSTGMGTWQNIYNYTETLVRLSYLSSWDMLQRKFDPNSDVLTITRIEPRVQASVSRNRVIGWLVIQVVFALTCLPILYLEKAHKDVGEIKGPSDFILQVHNRTDSEITNESGVTD